MNPLEPSKDSPLQLFIDMIVFLTVGIILGIMITQSFHYFERTEVVQPVNIVPGQLQPQDGSSGTVDAPRYSAPKLEEI